MKTIAVTTNQVSQPEYVAAGSRVTLSGSGYVEWTPAQTLQDAKQSGATWQTWPGGTSEGSQDVVRGMAIRVVGTGDCTVTVEAGRRDDVPNGQYWDAETVTAQIDPLTGRMRLQASGAAYDLQDDDMTVPATADVIDFMAPSASLGQFKLPTPYASIAEHVTHPSIIYVPQGFAGYRWWCAYTPYPNSNSQYENPCIAACRDGESWEVPSGASNPLVPHPGGSAYNSDTHLILAPDGQQMILLFRSRGVSAKNRLYIMTTSDGRAWSSPTEIWTGDQGVADLASPSLWYNDTSAKWEIIGHDLDNASHPVVKITSSSLLSGWDAVASAVTIAPLAGRKWWHSTFLRLSSGRIVGLVMDNNGGSGSPGQVFVAQSDDGATFTTWQITSGTDQWYRPNLVLRQDAAGDVTLHAYFSKLNADYIYSASAKIPRRSRGGDVAAIGAALTMAANAPSAVLWGDTFNRADDATGMGTATSGGAYAQLTADKIGISGNRAYSTNTNNCRATADLGTPDFTAAVVFASAGSQGWLQFRHQDANNSWRVGFAVAGGPLRLQRIAGGSVVTDIVLGKGVSNGDAIRVGCYGSSIEVYHNGARVYTLSDATFKTATKIGLQASGATPTYFDSLAAWK